jgi:ankyrin repeat protein
MARKKAKQKQETTLVPHRTPNLSALLERAKEGASAQAIKAFLDAGGSAMAILKVNGPKGVLRLPLLHFMALKNSHPHTELAECVRLLVEAGADINTKAGAEGDARTALMCASERSCCTRVVQVFLERDADVLISMANGLTALHLAATAGRTNSCELLLARDSSLIHVQSAEGYTALMGAVKFGCIKTVKMLQRHGANLSTASSYGSTALMAAAVDKRVDMVLYLLKAGVDVDAKDSRGHTALIGAVCQNSIPIVQLLLEHGADVSVTDCQGQNALFKATHYGHVFMMDMLVKRGLNITAVDDEGYTVLLIAIHSQQKAAAEWLLQHGAAVGYTGVDGVTALHAASASSSGDAAMIKLLLANGADVHKVTDAGKTALDLAVCCGAVQCAEVLIQAGADVNHIDDRGKPCLHEAIIEGHVDLVKLLLEHGAIAVINSVLPIQCLHGVQCCTHATALMMCADVSIAKLLLAAGADVHVTDNTGDTCLHVATRHKYKVPVICLLIKAGADLHAVNIEGKTAADIAHDNGDALLEQLLNRAAQQG